MLCTPLFFSQFIQPSFREHPFPCKGFKEKKMSKSVTYSSSYIKTRCVFNHKKLSLSFNLTIPCIEGICHLTNLKYRLYHICLSL